MRGVVIVLVEKCQEPDLHFVQARALAEEVETAFAEGSPETFHLAACGGVVRRGVDKSDPEAATCSGEGFSSIRRAVVEIQTIGFAVLANGLAQ